MLKIYFTASTSVSPEVIKRYKKLYQALKRLNVLIVSGEQVVNPKLLEKDKTLTAEEIFLRQKEHIDGADAVIAEVTNASHGVGGEIVYALTQNKPVLALVHAGEEDVISPMIVGNPSDRLFLEYYNGDNGHFKMKEFLQHVATTNKKKGKFVVIDGGDGSGKTTQAKMLITYLKKKKIPVTYFDFPQYYQSFHGKTVAKYLRGEFGNVQEVSPYLASLAYALDRASVKHEMEGALKRGEYIIANRYVSSNLAHQGAKFDDPKEREDYITWEQDLEYKVHKIPREDIVIYLYVPWQISDTLVKKRGAQKYLKGEVQDIHEKDINHRTNAQTMYLELAKKHSHWVMIDCTENGTIAPMEEIHKKIIATLIKKRIISQE
ncbi:MAG: hypothetical protein RI947_1089 [Candidatus Parcubacteria bacterium]|jgi:dTMP kinase